MQTGGLAKCGWDLVRGCAIDHDGEIGRETSVRRQEKKRADPEPKRHGLYPGIWMAIYAPMGPELWTDREMVMMRTREAW